MSTTLNDEQETLKKYSKKLSENIYDTIASICILRTIEEVAEKVNEDGHGAYYSYIQKQMINSSMLSLSKIFDTDKKSVSINKINTHIQCNYRKIVMQEPMISERADAFKHFNKDNLLSISNSLELAKYLFSKFTELEELNKDDLKALKDLRDRHIAHSDTRAIQYKTTWEKVDELIEFLLEYLDLIEFMLFTTVWSGDGDAPCSTLVPNAKSAGCSLARTFQKLGYIENISEIKAIK